MKKNNLQQWRKKIDLLDDVIMEALELRFYCVRALAPHKDKTLADKAREQQILKKCPSAEVRSIYQKIFQEGIKVMKKEKRSSKAHIP